MNLRGEQEDSQPALKLLVTAIDHEAKGQCTLIEYGNGTRSICTDGPLLSVLSIFRHHAV